MGSEVDIGDGELIATFKRTATGWSVSVDKVPGVVVSDESVKKTMTMLRSALIAFFQAKPHMIPMTIRTPDRETFVAFLDEMVTEQRGESD